MNTKIVSFGWITIDLKDLPALNVVGEFASDYSATTFTQRVLSCPIVEASSLSFMHSKVITTSLERKAKRS